MPPLSAYTPFESLLFFQCLASLNNRPVNFSAISDTLRKNQFIKDNAAFDTDRLSPQALEELYTTLLQEGLDEPSSAGEKNGHLQDGTSANPKKRKITSGNIANVGHITIVPEVVSQLYARYKDRVTKEIRDEEKRYRDISEEIKRLQKDAAEESVVTAAQGVKAPEALAAAQSSSERMDVDVKDDTKATKVVASTISKAPEQSMVDFQPRPAIPIQQTAQPMVPPVTTTPRPSLPDHGPSIAETKKQQPPPPPIPTLPEVALQSQQMLQQQQTVGQPPPSVTFTRPLEAPINGKGTPLASQTPASLVSSPKIQVKVPPPPQQPQRLPPQAAPRGQPTLPPGSTIVFQAQQGKSQPSTPIAQRHPRTGESVLPKGTPVPAGSPVLSQLSQPQQPFQQWTPHPVPTPPIPATPYAQSPYGTQPMLNRPPAMPKQGNFIPQTDVTGKPIPVAFQSTIPVTPATLPSATQTPMAQMQQPHTTPFTGTPSIPVGVRTRPNRPSMDTAGSLTPWKRTPTLRIDIPETPGSPPRPKPEDVSPISETAPSPIEPAESLVKGIMPQIKRGQPEAERPRRGRKPSVAPSGAETVISKSEKSTAMLGKKRASSTTSTASRARSIASRDEDSATDSAVITQRKIKHEAPSTPAGVSEDVDVETRAGSRRKAVAATSLGEEAHVKSRPKRKRGASETLEVDIAHPTPTRAVSSQLVYCTRNFARTGAPIMNDVAAHKHASIFAKPLTERDAPGYKDLIYRPQDLKSIRSALTHGNKAIAAATEAVNSAAEGESPNPPAATGTPSKNTAWLAKTPELIPPKAIVNSSQLEKELIRMFANAVMYNPAPERERGFGRAFPMRKPNEPRPSSHPWELDEGGIIRDTREMCDDVEKAVTKWRAAERTTTDDSTSKSMLSLRGSSGDSNADGTDADNKG